MPDEMIGARDVAHMFTSEPCGRHFATVFAVVIPSLVAIANQKRRRRRTANGDHIEAELVEI